VGQGLAALNWFLAAWLRTIRAWAVKGNVASKLMMSMCVIVFLVRACRFLLFINPPRLFFKGQDVFAAILLAENRD